jgi:outer membrane protein assembly factor BamB
MPLSGGDPLRKVCSVLCLLLLSANAFGQDRLLWEVQEDFSGGVDLARAVTLSKKGIVVVGTAGTPDGGLDFVIQSLRRSTGTVQWGDRVSSCCIATRVLVTSLHNTVFAAAYSPGAEVSSRDIFVRAYHAPTGTLLWESVWDAGRDGLPRDIAASPSAVVVAGYGGNTPVHGSLNFVVRAYDPVSGAVLWEDQVDRSPDDSVASAVAIDRNRVFVAGTTGTPSGQDLLLRAYDASSGKLTWEFAHEAAFPTALKAISGRVFLTGSASSQPYIAAFEGKSGLLLWDDAPSISGAFNEIAVKHERIVAAGSSGTGLLVRAYDVRNGHMAWQDQTSVLPGYGEVATAIALSDDAVYIGGSSRKDFVYSEVLVRAYDSADGSLLWDDRSHRTRNSAAVDLALGKNRLFVAGYTYTAPNNTDFLIRAYRVRTDGTAPPP